MCIHIGQPKTASTALQRALAAHPEVLATAEAVYPLISGRPDHQGELADLQLRHTAGADISRSGNARLFRRARRGSWEQLVSTVQATKERVVVSDETMSALPSALARQVVDELTGRSPHKATIVLAVRPLSQLLASTYAQLAQDTVLPSFETWTRLWLRYKAQETGLSASGDWTDGFQVASNWSATGAEVRCVHYENNSEIYWDHMVDALGLAEVGDQFQIPRANPSMTALGLAAWQHYLRTGVDPFDPATKQLRKAVRAELKASSNSASGGHFALTPEVAALVDAAFPQPPAGQFSDSEDERVHRWAATREPRARMQERLLEAAPLSTPSLAGSSEEVLALTRRITALAADLRA